MSKSRRRPARSDSRRIARRLAVQMRAAHKSAVARLAMRDAE